MLGKELGTNNSILGTVSFSFKLLDQKSRRKILGIFLVQSSLSILDLIGVGLMGVLGAVAVRGIQSEQNTGKAAQVLRLMGISKLDFQSQVIFLALLACVALVLRTLLSIYFGRRILYFLSRKSGEISAKIANALLKRPLVEIQENSTQQTLFSITSGVNALTLGLIGTTLALLTDFILLLFIFFGLVFVDPIMAISTLLLFGLISVVLYRLLHNRAQKLGTMESQVSISSNETIIEILSSYRESFVRSRIGYYSSKIERQRLKLSDVTAEMAFMPNISKYVLEISVVIGALLIGALQFFVDDAMHAISTLLVFLAAGTRVAPAVLRTQQGAIQIRSSMGQCAPTLKLLSNLSLETSFDHGSHVPDMEYRDFNPKIEISSASYRYPLSLENALTDINIEISPGSVVAVVGASGAGKSSLVDLILGILSPQKGSVSISDRTPQKAINKWPGAIGYVPQDVFIADTTIRENITLGYEDCHENDLHLWNCLQKAQLVDVVENLPDVLNSEVGENGSKLSGGQRQRLGIARALFTNPKLLILDESTSALDSKTESDLSDAIGALKGKVTVILIAHRLSSIRQADAVILLDKGKVLCSGTFDEVRKQNPEFDHQANLMGL
jgi:ABC-type multidrug transport system fused ATPase/permease subunit